jgi:hypothetical protein
MTAFRLISLGLHGALELVVGLALMASPFVLAFGPAATVASLAVGGLIVGLALAAATIENGGSVATHHAFDWGAVLGLAGAGILFALVGEVAAGTVFVAVALVESLLALTTRYSLAR